MDGDERRVEERRGQEEEEEEKVRYRYWREEEKLGVDGNDARRSWINNNKEKLR